MFILNFDQRDEAGVSKALSLYDKLPEEVGENYLAQTGFSESSPSHESVEEHFKYLDIKHGIRDHIRDLKQLALNNDAWTY